MMKKIVYATNGSENSIAALKYTYALRKFFDSDIIILHIIKFPSKISPDEEKKVFKEEKQRLENFCSTHLGESFENLDLTVALRKDKSVIEGIKDFIRDMDLHLLVIGACGSGPIRELLIGSTAGKMITNTVFPVLSVPRGFVYKTPERILYPTDFEEEDIFHIKNLLKIFAPHHVQITIVHVSSPNTHQDKISKPLSLFEKIKVNLQYDKLEYKLLFEKNIVETLANFIEEKNFDIVAMLERQNGHPPNNILRKDIVEKIHSQVKVPLLVFKKRGYDNFMR